MTKDYFSLDVAIPCDCGQLEGRLLYKDDNPKGPGLIVCPPHPLLAGNMDNNVVLSIAETMAATMPVLLFNYRAVGKSSHPEPELPVFEYWNDLDERRQYDEVVREVSQVMKWSQDYFTGFHVLGYSFGSYIALQAMNGEALSYTAITPPLAEHDYSSLQDLELPGSVILAEKDGLLNDGTQQVPENIHNVHILRCTDHFFLNRENDVVARVSDFLQNLEKRSY